MAEPFRPFKKTFSYQEVCEMCRTTDLSKRRQSGLIGRFRPPFATYFSGKSYTFFFDNGKTLYYRFLDEHNLEWSEDGETYFADEYDALESTVQNVFLIHHMRRSTIPFQGLTLIVDAEKELITWVDLHFGTEDCDKNVNYSVAFGWFGTPKTERHSFTTEMCGVILDWKYADEFLIRHAYVTTYSMICPAGPTDNEDDYLFCKTLPAIYTKVRDGLYTVSFAEDGNDEVTLLIDLERRRDVGAFFGLSDEGQLTSFTIGAVAGRGKFGFTGKFSIDPGPSWN